MAITVQDIIQEAQALQALAEDQATKSDASHAAADEVVVTTQTQADLVAQAQASAKVAINAAQADADAAKALTDAATETLDTAIQKLIADVQTLVK
jgi:hypothetical protein